MSNPPPPSSGSLSSASMGNLASTPVAAANASTNSAGSMLLANNNHGSNPTTVAAAVAAAAVAAKMNGNAIHQQHRLSAATPVPSSPSLITCHPNGIGGGSTVLLSGGCSGASSNNQSAVYQSHSPLSQLSAAKAIAAAVAAAAATVAQQQQTHYRQQQLHPLSTSLTATSPQLALPSKSSSIYIKNKSIPIGDDNHSSGSMRTLTGSSQKQSSVTSNTPNVALGTGTGTSVSSGTIPSILGSFTGGECNDTVRTLVATVGATSMIATLASPVPSKMLLTTSSSGSHSNISIGSTVNHVHRFITGGLSPSSSSSTATGVGTFTPSSSSSSSTAVNPMDSHTQSNAFNISNKSGSQNVELSSTSPEVGASNNIAKGEPYEAQKDLSSALDVNALYNEGAMVQGGSASEEYVENSISCSINNIHRKCNTLKHKVTDKDDDGGDEPATKRRVPGGVCEANDYSNANMTETGELMSEANGNESGGIDGKDAAIIRTFAANGIAAGGQSPRSTTPLERCKIPL